MIVEEPGLIVVTKRAGAIDIGSVDLAVLRGEREPDLTLFT